MTNIWGFFIQTISVSVVAGMILLLKRVMRDKLSPRWQYAVWSIFLASCVIPVNVSRSIVPQIYIWMETIKGIVEKQLTSQFTFVYEPIIVHHVIPIVKANPNSITDWLMIIYIAGVLFCLLRYIISYFRLSVLLKQGKEIVLPFHELCERYDLKTLTFQIFSWKRKNFLCHHVKSDILKANDAFEPQTNNPPFQMYKAFRDRYEKFVQPHKVVVIDGIGSAFVCGVFRPVLVLPKDHVEDMILLHEMMHLKYKDILQGMVWCVVRSLHWCNPFIQYICNQIENDMESLCDQRVLECLEGEERRNYGKILLNMANNQYARIPGTSSISNGGKNISRRIEAIVRFKKYPNGMGIVSVCSIVLLSSLLGFGNTYTYTAMDYSVGARKELSKAMAMARLNRCTTLAGALDTYAKGLLFENGIYIASASSFEKHEALEKEMYRNSKEDGWAVCHLDTSEYLNDVITESGYQVLNLIKKAEDCYEAYLVFEVIPKGEDYYAGQSRGHTVLVPVEVTKEDAWVVKEIGEHLFYPNYFYNIFYETDFPAQKHYYGYSEKVGKITGTLRTICTVDNTKYNNQNTYNYTELGGFWTNTSFDKTPKTNAEFSTIKAETRIDCDYRDIDTKEQLNTCITIITTPLKSKEDNPVFPEDVPYGVNTVGSSSQGYDWVSNAISKDNDKIVTDYTNTSYNSLEEIEKFYGYAVRVYWDFVLIDEVTIVP